MTSSDLAERLGAGEGDALLRDPQQRAELFALDAFPAGCTNPELGHAVLCELDLLAIGAGSPGLEPHLAECAACAAEEADAKDSLAELEAPASTPQVGLRCIYCHDGLEVASAAYCASCLAIHHSECFQEHGTCAAPGCGETRWVRSSAPQPVATPSRFRGLWQVAAGLLVCGLVGVGAYVGYASNAREEARRVALRQAAAERAARDAAKVRIAELEAELQLLIAKQQYQEARSLIETATPQLLGIKTPITEVEELNRLLELLDVVQGDQVSYDKALEIIRGRRVDLYPEAWDHLQEIDPRSRSIYPDARAYLFWMEGERRRKSAEDLAVKGEVLQAEDLLTRALNSYRSVDLAQVTSETAATLRSALQESSALSGRWKSGAEALGRAEALIKDDRLEQARFDLLLTLEYLPAGTPQAKQAQAYLDQLEQLRKSEDARLLYQRRRDGFDRSVRRQDWRSAHDWATQLVKNHTLEVDYLIEAARKAELKLGLFASAEKILKDRDAPEHLLVWARDVFVFLAAWLPPNDPKAALASLNVNEVMIRLGAERNAEASPPVSPEYLPDGVPEDSDVAPVTSPTRSPGRR